MTRLLKGLIRTYFSCPVKKLTDVQNALPVEPLRGIKDLGVTLPLKYLIAYGENASQRGEFHVVDKVL